MIRTHTRTHVYTVFANPYLQCDRCHDWTPSWHNPDHCGCAETRFQNQPCGHQAGVTSTCPSWGSVDGCTCDPIAHSIPPTSVVDGRTL